MFHGPRDPCRPSAGAAASLVEIMAALVMFVVCSLSSLCQRPSWSVQLLEGIQRVSARTGRWTDDECLGLRSVASKLIGQDTRAKAKAKVTRDFVLGLPPPPPPPPPPPGEFSVQVSLGNRASLKNLACAHNKPIEGGWWWWFVNAKPHRSSQVGSPSCACSPILGPEWILEACLSVRRGEGNHDILSDAHPM